MSNSNPSLELDPANAGSMPGMMRMVLRKFLQNVDGMLPVTVIAADDKREFATVQIAILVVGTDDTLTKRAQIAKVPIFNIGAGGWVLTFPIKPGDPGWIVANDRDISLYIQSAKAAAPNTNRFHTFEDGLFIPDAARKFTLDAADADCVVIQSLDKTTRIALGTDKIKIIHPTKVEVTCPLVTMSGDLTVAGTITGQTDVIADTISGKTHTHSGVTTGGGDTGAPV